MGLLNSGWRGQARFRLAPRAAAWRRALSHRRRVFALAARRCALDCVHSCLGKCANAEAHAASSGGSQCYAACTKPCLPKCVGAPKALSVEALAAAAEAHAAKGRAAPPLVEALSSRAHSAAPVETSELEIAALGR